MLTIKNEYRFVRKKIIRTINNLRRKKHIATNIGDCDFHKHIIKYNVQRPYGCDYTICHTPMRSIYWGFEGVVTACCFNRDYVLGKFPENSVEEIIHGEKRKQLQQHLDKSDFSHGCQLCKNMIESGNYNSVNAHFADNFPAQGDFPSEMVFELDNSCNLKCEMCSARFSSAHDGGKRTVAPYDNDVFIEQLKPFIPHLVETKFLGGEPFLSDIYPKIWELIIAINPKCKIRIQSNGTILNEKIKDILQHGNFQIGLSIDTLNPEHYAKIRNGAKIEKTLENLDFFSQISHKNGENMNISVCPMKENRFDIPDLVKFCNDKDILIYFNDVSTEGYALGELSTQELDELITYYKCSDKQGRTYISKNNHTAFSNLIKEVVYLKEQRKQYEYMNEMILCPQKEFVEMMLLIIGDVKSIDIERGKYLLKYIPENFLIKRSEYLYLKNMTTEELKEFFSRTSKDQIQYLKDFLLPL